MRAPRPAGRLRRPRIPVGRSPGRSRRRAIAHFGDEAAIQTRPQREMVVMMSLLTPQGTRGSPGVKGRAHSRCRFNSAAELGDKFRCSGPEPDPATLSGARSAATRSADARTQCRQRQCRYRRSRTTGAPTASPRPIRCDEACRRPVLDSVLRELEPRLGDACRVSSR